MKGRPLRLPACTAENAAAKGRWPEYAWNRAIPPGVALGFYTTDIPWRIARSLLSTFERKSQHFCRAVENRRF